MVPGRFWGSQGVLKVPRVPGGWTRSWGFQNTQGFRGPVTGYHFSTMPLNRDFHFYALRRHKYSFLFLKKLRCSTSFFCNKEVLVLITHLAPTMRNLFNTAALNLLHTEESKFKSNLRDRL